MKEFVLDDDIYKILSYFGIVKLKVDLKIFLTLHIFTVCL